MNKYVAMHKGKYLHVEHGDGPYYFFYEVTEKNLDKYPPMRFNDNDKLVGGLIQDELTAEDVKVHDIEWKEIYDDTLELAEHLNGCKPSFVNKKKCNAYIGYRRRN